MSAVRISTADGQAVTVTSHGETVPNWAARYLGAWWTTEPTTQLTGPVVSGDVDETELRELTAVVTGGDPQRIEYAGAEMLYVRDGAMVTATQPDEGLAYRWDGGRKLLRIVSTDETAAAAAATARLARELVRAQLLTDGWEILHASAVTSEDGATILTLGDKGAGKTTTAFTLARAGWAMLANDRVFARVDDTGTVRVLPWPSAAAIGFGLLDALDLYETVREHLTSGEQMHPTQHQTVTDALLTGHREPLWKKNGKGELKPQFFPDQLTSWLSIPLATQGHVVGILFPQITADAAPRLIETSRGVQDGDFFDEATEDRYPDTFSLLPPPADHTALRVRLAELPRQGLVMGHDTSVNTALLKEAVGRLDA
ncbi:hypothetical protein R1T08_06890 [Streptomyces sp. SBC-4]|nr:hypothetical protein [Streptomyces sp. SBC-4]MDV5143996.1 hypothetical protein [Streptomyces sp. SBC-4]